MLNFQTKSSAITFFVLLTAFVMTGCQSKQKKIIEQQKLVEKQEKETFIIELTDKIIASKNTPIELSFEEVATLEKIIQDKKQTPGIKRFSETQMDVGVLAAQARFNEILQPEKIVFVRYTWTGEYLSYICLDFDNTLVDDGYGTATMAVPWYTN